MFRWPFTRGKARPSSQSDANGPTEAHPALNGTSTNNVNPEVQAKVSAARPALAFQLPAPQLSDKPVDRKLDGLHDVTDEELVNALEAIVEHSVPSETQNPTQVLAFENHGTQMLAKDVFEAEWVEKLIPGLERWATEFHWGNFVVQRKTGERIFESMPIYARIGMHLLFFGDLARIVVKTKTVQFLLKEQSIRQGKLYDSPSSVSAIPSFISTYDISLDELLEPDPTKYKTFNTFFARTLKAGARPIDSQTDPNIVTSCSDSRLMVYKDVPMSRHFWIKGKRFTAPGLLGHARFSKRAFDFHGGSIAIHRLAPADYHRFHSPVDGVIVSAPKVIKGEYYTVNPQAVNQNLDVFTANARSVVYIKEANTGKKIAIVAVGALLVGSIVWTSGREMGKEVKKGQELGHFAYGGSTVIVLFPKGFVEFDADLVKNSQEPIETLVRMGEHIGSRPTKTNKV